MPIDWLLTRLSLHSPEFLHQLMMEDTLDLDKGTFFIRFDARDLGPDFFDHRGHLYMAWAHLERYDLQEASRRVCEGIRELAIKFEAPEKYNHTVTEALLRITDLRLQRAKQEGFDAFLEANSDLVYNAKAVLAKHYSSSRLNSNEARSSWVEPDLAPIV